MIGLIISSYGICVVKHSDTTVPNVSRDTAVSFGRKAKRAFANTPVRIGIYTVENCSKNSIWVGMWKNIKFIIKTGSALNFSRHMKK